MFKLPTLKKLILLHIFILFSFSVFSQKTLKSEVNNKFIITSTQVPDSILSVVDYATEVWSAYITSDIPIRLHVTWRELAPNINAYAKPSQVYYNIEGLPYSDVLYPAALAEKILSKNLNLSNPDIELVINSLMQWNVDYTHVPSPNTFDLATILIHEICHGLGFIGNIGLQDSKPSLVGVPTIFDKFVGYRDSLPLLPFFTNTLITEDSLTDILTSDSIFWIGNYVESFMGFKPKLYSPSTFNPGSSIYHFDEILFPVGDSNSLMTFVIGSQEVMHYPGIVTLALLADLGWNDYFISHSTVPNISDVSQVITLDMTCIDSLYKETEHTILYSFDNGRNFVEIPLQIDLVNDSYTVDLPSFPFEHIVSYAFRSVTQNNDTLYIPVEYPNKLYSIFVGEDIQAPEIQHTVLTSIPVNYSEIEFSSSVIDNFEIDSVYIQYIVGRNEFATILGTGRVVCSYSDFMYKAILPIDEFNLVEGDMLAYNIIAVDKSSNITSIVPIGEYNFATIDAILDPLLYFVTNFESDTIVDYFNVDKFSISLEDNFLNKALHTQHPYVSSFIDGKYVQFIAELKYPIKIAQNPAVMEFDEVVLVEPSEPNVAYGMYGFWDFVVVEATKDKKSGEWFPLGKEGYDSRYNDVWFQTFYSSLISDNNNSSSAIGTESLYRKHEINLLENKYFRETDTIYIRFRLQSDFNRHGWGWAIDNLKIQENQVALKQINKQQCNVYPTICKNDLFISCAENIYSIWIYDASGKLIQPDLKENSNTISLQKLYPGLYSILIRYNNGDSFSQTFIKE